MVIGVDMAFSHKHPYTHSPPPPTFDQDKGGVAAATSNVWRPFVLLLFLLIATFGNGSNARILDLRNGFLRLGLELGSKNPSGK